LIVILNDNAIGIDPSVGALKSYLMQVKNGENPKQNNIVKSLNFKYKGPIDGHNLYDLINELQKLKRGKGPQFLHVVTTKGKGLKQAEENQVLYHAPGKFDKITGDIVKPIKTILPKYQDVFGLTLLELAKNNNKIFAITPAMPTGSSLKYMMDVYPERAIDVGIAEQHAVTLAAGIAKEGFTVYCAVYSTFLQRAYDQVIHDVVLQNLPVIFCIDRAGLVGEDGATHQGVYDIAYLNILPNIKILAPKDAVELRNALYTLQLENTMPVAIRYPRGTTSLVNWQLSFKKIDFSKIEIIKKGINVAILSTGTILSNVLSALTNYFDFSVYHFIQIKPLNHVRVIDIIKQYQTIITIEEGVVNGGFGSSINKIVLDNNIHLK